MKQAEILKIIAVELGTGEVAEVNKILKASAAKGVKFRFSGKKLGHFGFTGAIKLISEVGVKVFDVNKITMIKFADIELFEKAKPRVERPKRPKPALRAVVSRKEVKQIKEEDEGEWLTKKQRAPVKKTGGSIYTKAKRR